MKHSIKLWMCGITCMLVCIGCSISGIILDRSQFEIPAKSMTLVNGSTLCILHGNTLREVSLSRCVELEIMPEISTTFNRELYYGAKIVLKNEGPISTSNKDSSKAENQVYLNINNTIKAQTKDATVLVPLDNIYRLTINK